MTGYCYDVQYKRFKDPIPVGKIPDKQYGTVFWVPN